MSHMKVVIIGAGAAGYFAAINIKSLLAQAEVVILEKMQQALAKVKVSGGGRCNVTHSCFDTKALIKGYPRGYKELLGSFHRFQPKDMIQWLEDRGVALKTEKDGRMFPVTDSSQTIIDCFKNEATKLGVLVRYGAEVAVIHKQERFTLTLASNEAIVADAVLIATGSLQKSYRLIESLNHTIVSPVPSLFAFDIEDERLEGLSGVSMEEVEARVLGLKQRGPMLITHSGLSGPAILKLSAWGAKALHAANYKATLELCFLPNENSESLKRYFDEKRKRAPSEPIAKEPLGRIPKKLWKKLTQAACIPEDRVFCQLRNEESSFFIEELLQAKFEILGKSTNKEEFVTCGGVALDEVDLRSMQSKILKGLYFAGEVLDIDGITGGFNFQNAWTTAFLASNAIAHSIQK